MKAVFLLARVDLRERWRSWLALAALVALAGGSVIALAAGARRTDSAYPRFLHAERAADVLLFLSASGTPDPAQVARLPQVAEASVTTVLQPGNSDFVLVVLPEGGRARSLDGLKFLAGRPPRPDRPEEVAVGFVFARDRHLRVGSQLPVDVPGLPPPGPSADTPTAAGSSPAGQVVSLRVVGIEAAPGEFPQSKSTTSMPAVYVSPGFVRTDAGARLANADSRGIAVAARLHRGNRDVAGFRAELERVGGGLVGSSLLADQTANVERSFYLQAIALWLVAGFAGFAAALILVQLLARQSAEDATGYPTLRALGVTSGQLLASALVRVAAMGVAGAVGAVGVAAALSPSLPLGTPRVAEPHPGFAFDATAIGLGAATIVVLVTLLGAAASYRSTRTACTPANEDGGSNRSSVVADSLAATGVPLVVTTGVRLALQTGNGRSAVPVRPTLAAAAIGVGAMAAAVTFGASLQHLLATPTLYGVTFDAHIEGTGYFSDITPAVPTLRADPVVAAVAVGATGIPLQAGPVNFDGWSTASVQGSLTPTVIEGRLPSAPDEILLGSRTMADLHVHLGQTVDVALRDLTRPVAFRVVGRGVLAPITDNELLGKGAVLAPDGSSIFAALVPPGFETPPPGDAFVRFRPGVTKAAAVARLQDELGPESGFRVRQPTEPADIANFGEVDTLPEILAGLLGMLAAAALAYLLVSAVRRRRRDLAVLKTLGFVPRQVSAAIAWQATTVALVASVLGLPLGLAAGRWAWSSVAGQAGVVVRPTVPWALLCVLTPAAVLIANLVSAGPALVAGRIQPAVVLRSE